MVWHCTVGKQMVWYCTHGTYWVEDNGLTLYTWEHNGLTLHIREDNGLTLYIWEHNGLTLYIWLCAKNTVCTKRGQRCYKIKSTKSVGWLHTVKELMPIGIILWRQRTILPIVFEWFTVKINFWQYVRWISTNYNKNSSLCS